MLRLVNTVGTSCWTRRSIATNVSRATKTGYDFFQAGADETPATHILRFFLYPDQLLSVWITPYCLAESVERERIKLFESH